MQDGSTIKRPEWADSDKPDRSTHACKGCLHFYVTYDPGFPYGCRAMGFKSRNYPYVQVQAASGTACQMRQPRKA